MRLQYSRVATHMQIEQVQTVFRSPAQNRTRPGMILTAE